MSPSPARGPGEREERAERRRNPRSRWPRCRAAATALGRSRAPGRWLAFGRELELRHRLGEQRRQRDLPARRERRVLRGDRRGRGARGRAAPDPSTRRGARDRPGPGVADDVAPLEVVDARGLCPVILLRLAVLLSPADEPGSLLEHEILPE